jgi:hypothetical protein
MSRSTGPNLPVREGSGVVMQHVVPVSTSLCERASGPPRVSWPQTPPLCAGGLQSRHASHGSGPCLPMREGSGAATRSVAPNPASLLGGLQSHHVSHGIGPRFPAWRASEPPRVPQHRTPPPCSEGSGAATRPAAPDPASQRGRARGRGVSHYSWEINKEVSGYNG